MGVFEEAKGRIKQAAGDVTDNDTLKTEGEAQSDKAVEERRSDTAKASAKAHEKKADLHEEKQEMAEKA
jgi:uncharacterized protein YjbJ (UPF0337 family)